MKKFTVYSLQFTAILLSISYLLLPTSFVLAQAPPGVNLTIDMVITGLQTLACWFFRIAATTVVIMLIVYGLMYVFSGGDSAKFQDARKALTWGIIGAFIVLGVYVIILSVAAFIGAAAPALFSC